MTDCETDEVNSKPRNETKATTTKGNVYMASNLLITLISFVVAINFHSKIHTRTHRLSNICVCVCVHMTDIDTNTDTGTDTRGRQSAKSAYLSGFYYLIASLNDF